MPTRTRRRTLRKHRGRVPVITTPPVAAPISEAAPVVDHLEFDVIDVEQAIEAEFFRFTRTDPATLPLAEAAAGADSVRFEVRLNTAADSTTALTHVTAVSGTMIRAAGWDTVYNYATEGTTRMATNTFDTNTAYYLNTAATNVWTAWNGTAASSSSVTQIWADWQTSSGSITQIPAYRPPARREATPEEIAAIAERQRQWEAGEAERRRERAEAAAQQAEAAARARELLLDVLTPEQREQFVATERFRVRGSKGGVYEVRCNSGVSGNVRGRSHKNLDGREHSYCIHPTNGVPRHDTYLAQKLLLEHDEDEFLRVANAS